MKSDMASAFSVASQIFKNIGKMRLNSHEIDSPIIAEIIRISSRLFKTLDRADPIQQEISRLLWVLRSSILFTLLPFDDPILSLLEQAKGLRQLSTRLPEAESEIDGLIAYVETLVGDSENPKGKWLEIAASDWNGQNSGRIGFLRGLAGGRPPGWPTELSPRLMQLTRGLTLINSRNEWRSGVFERMILPCGCRNVSSVFLAEILYSGRTEIIDVILYSGETFRQAHRMRLPSTGIFGARTQETQLREETDGSSSETGAASIDSWANEAFWQGLHGADRTTSKDFVPANYILFCDGTGAFLPSARRVETLPPDGLVAEERDIRLSFVENINEGDFVVLRAGESGILLDAVSDRIITGSGDENLFAAATDWKEALEALLVTHSCGDVVRELRAKGVTTTAATILHWSGTDVLGPGDEEVFKGLLALLAKKGKIEVSAEALPSYVESRWSSLQQLRSVRQRAGNAIRQELFEALVKEFGKKSHQIRDKESIRLADNSNVELLVLRVSSVDRNQAFVPQSRLCQLDDLKDNKWLG